MVGTASTIVLLGTLALFRGSLPAAPVAVAFARALDLGSLAVGPERREFLLVGSPDERSSGIDVARELERMLGERLRGEPAIHLLPSERLNSVLALMRTSPETPLDESVARGVARRDGSIRAIVLASTDSSARTPAVNVQIVDSRDGCVVSQYQESIEAGPQPAAAVQAAGAWVADTIDDWLPQTRTVDEQLEKVTTRSLEALRLFIEAVRLWGEKQPAASHRLTLQAIEEDPEFASAHQWLTWTLGRRGDDQLQAAQEAVDRLAGVSDRERYFILGRYHGLRGEPDEEQSAYETLVALHPDHRWGVSNLSNRYLQTDRTRTDDAARMQMSLADLRPGNFKSQMWDGMFALTTGELDRAAEYMTRARTLEPRPGNSRWRPLVTLFPAYRHWIRGDARTGLEELDRVAATLETERLAPIAPTLNSPELAERNRLFVAIGSLHLSFGRVKDAGSWLGRTPTAPCPRSGCKDWDSIDLSLAQVGLDRRNWEAVRTHVGRHLDRVGSISQLFVGQRSPEFLAWFLVRTGLHDEASQALTHRRQLDDEIHTTKMAAAAGEIALHEGDLGRGVPPFSNQRSFHAASGTRRSARSLRLSRTRTRSREFSSAPSGHWRRARPAGCGRGGITVPSGCSGSRTSGGWPSSIDGWDRMDRAREVEDDLTRILARTDADHPVLLDLQRLEAMGARKTDAN